MSKEDVSRAFDAAEEIDLGTADAAPPVDMSELDEERAAEGATFPLNDYGNGLRLSLYYGENALWVPRLGWFRWDGRKWASDEDEVAVRRDAQQIATRILHEIPFIALDEWQREALELWRNVKDEYAELSAKAAADRSPEEVARFSTLQGIKEAGVRAENTLADLRKTHRAYAKSSGNSGKISNMMAEAKTALAVDVSELNADPMALNCANGVLRFTMAPDDHGAAWGGPARRPAVELLPHDRAQRITKMVAAEYHPGAACPTWLAFLERVQPDPEVRAFLRRWFGYSMTGKTSEQKLAFFYGGGRNGKSTAVDTIARIMADYGTTIPIETLTGAEQRKGSDATPDLVRLPGARFVRASEPEQGQKMKEALIKALTGGEAIMIRRMMQEFVEIVPEFKLTISGNHRPEVRGSDDGIWRRIMLVKFGQQIPIEEVDPELPAKLWAERDGILAWMVEGLLDYMAGGLRPPASVLADTEEYRADSDPMRVFLLEECEITGAAEDFEKTRDLGDAFNAWLLANGGATWGKRAVSNALKARSNNVKGPTGHVYEPAKRSDTGYRGIRLSSAAMSRISEFSYQLQRPAEPGQ